MYPIIYDRKQNCGVAASCGVFNNEINNSMKAEPKSTYSRYRQKLDQDLPMYCRPGYGRV